MKKKLALFLAITSLLCCSCEGSQTDGTTTTTPKISTTTTTTTSEAPIITTTTTDTEATVTTTTTTAQTSVTSEDLTTSEEENTTTPPDSTTTEPSDTTASSGSATTPEAEITTTTATTTATTTTPQTTVTPSTTTTATTSYTEMTATTMYATTSVNVRSGAGTSYNVLGKLSTNQSVTVIGTSGDWYAIEFNGKTGFVSKSYLSKNKVTTTTTANEPSGSEFTSKYAYGSEEYIYDLLDYYGIECTGGTRDFSDKTVVTYNYEAKIKEFIANANGRTVLYKNVFYDEIYDVCGVNMCYEVPLTDFYCWTEEDCFRLFDEINAYAESVGFTECYMPTEVTPFDGTRYSYGSFGWYECTGRMYYGGYWHDSETFESNYAHFLDAYKTCIDNRITPGSLSYGEFFKITLTTAEDYLAYAKFMGWETDIHYDIGRCDLETSYVFIINH